MGHRRMISLKRFLVLLLLLYVVLLSVNLAVNYSYYKSGGSWLFSIGFSLVVATVGWLGYALLYYRVFGERLNSKAHPTSRLVLLVLLSGVYGVLIMML